MVKLRLAQLLKQRRMTPYALFKASGLSLPTVYQLVSPEGVTRLELETIDKLCVALGCKVSELLVRVPDKVK